jgi:hypothetical protein
MMMSSYRRLLFLLCVLAFAIGAPLPASAASFNFSYAFESGKTLAGTFDGDIALDGDTITSISNVMATYDNNLVIATQGWGEASFSGNYLAFGGKLADSTAGFSFFALPPLLPPVGFPSPFDERGTGGTGISGGFVYAYTCIPGVSGTCYISLDGSTGGFTNTTNLDQDSLAVAAAGYGTSARPGSWSLSTAPIPEPTAALLFGSGALILGGTLRNRNTA